MPVVLDQQIPDLTGVSEEESLQKLEKVLIRVAITVEEAEGRFIRNKGMLQQLKVLQKEMYKGYYVLDKFKYLDGEEAKVNSHQTLSLACSISNPGKRRFRPSAVISAEGKKELKLTLDNVQNMVTDMCEFVAFLNNYPPMFRQPYSMHLLLEKCMFGRQAEMERTIYFLLQKEPLGESFSVGVLTIIGQGSVGKSTLVEHVCYDVRVRQHFSQILFFSGNKIIEEKQGTLKDMDGGITKHKNSSQNDGKLLVIIELDGDVEEGAWRRLLSASRSCLPSGSKIIVASRSEKVANFGTTQAIRLDFLCREACWYFFKVLLFGSSFAEDQPKLASIAMEIFEEYYCQQSVLFGDFTGSFANSKNIAVLLRSNVSTQHWRSILACIRRNWEENLIPSSTDPHNTRVDNGHYNICTISNMYQYVQVDRHRVVRSGHQEVPKITIDEVMYGRIAPKGKFEVLWWTSHLPPYYRYIASCEILDSKYVQEGKRCSKKRKELI